MDVRVAPPCLVSEPPISAGGALGWIELEIHEALELLLAATYLDDGLHSVLCHASFFYFEPAAARLVRHIAC